MSATCCASCAVGPRRADRGPLLCRHQPLDRGRLYHRLRAQPGARRGGSRWRCATPRRPRRRTTHRRACRPAARPRGPHGRGDRGIGRGDGALRGEPFRSISIEARPRPSSRRSRSASTAAIVTVEDDEPAILVAGDAAMSEPRAGLPFGPFDPLAHRTFEIGLRAWVEAQTGLASAMSSSSTPSATAAAMRAPATPARTWSRSAISRSRACRTTRGAASAGAGFEPWYRFFPWEDWRDGRPAILDDDILPLLNDGPRRRRRAGRALGRRERLRFASAPAARRGTRRACSIATSCSTRPA